MAHARLGRRVGDASGSHARTLRVHLLSALLSGAAAACGSSSGVPATAPPPPVRAPPPSDFEGGRLGSFQSKRFHVELPLPDGRAWRIDDRSTPWLSATHAGTSSTLWVRTWQEHERANTKSCEEKARLWKKEIPSRDGVEIVEHRAAGVPAGFDTWVDIGVSAAAKPGAPMRAFALAFGGRRHSCFAYVYITQAEGPGAERAIAARLAAMVQRSLSLVVAVDGLKPAVRRGPEVAPGRREEPSPPPAAPDR
jgi:hypothetical protein